MSNVLAGFIGGVSKYGLDQMSRAEEEEREIRKLKLLEQLRKDTEKEMAIFREGLARKKADKSMSTDDFVTGKRTLRNEYGEDIGTVDLPTSAVEDYKEGKIDKGLDRQYKEKQIANFDIDNARADRQLAISEGHLGIARDNAARARSLDTGDGILLAEANKAFETMKATGAPANEIALAQARWYDGVNNKKWSKEQQRIYLSSLLNNWATKAQAQAKNGLLETQLPKKED